MSRNDAQRPRASRLPAGHAGQPVPELLSPAGSPACLPAAVAGGADAVYLGLQRFSARARAENFCIEELGETVGYLHEHGLRCYVTLNTLVHDLEMPAAVETARRTLEAGADAVILQDLGLWRVLRQELPDLSVYASTQMTVHCRQQIEVLAALGARRIILARELSLEEIAACAATAAGFGVEVECFVHGALCYAYSGQCRMSFFAAGRSANRGACIQSCRFTYDLDGSEGPHLSMRDLCLLERIPEVVATGVASLKIEGRLKGPEYVFTVCRAYRDALTAVADGRAFAADARLAELREVFSRPFTLGPAFGELDETARQAASRDAGEPFDAELVRISRRDGTAVLRSAGDIAAGHGFRFTIEGADGGFLVTHARRQADGTWWCRVRVARRGPHLPAGLALYRNVDQARGARIRQSMREVGSPRPSDPVIGIHLEVEARLGNALIAGARTDDGRSARVEAGAVERARSQALDEDSLRASLGAFGGSGFSLRSLRADLEPGAFVPAALLKKTRRRLVEALEQQPRVVPTQWSLPELNPLARSCAVHVAVSSLAAADAALAAGADAVWLDDPTLDLWRGHPPRLSALPQGLWLRHPAVAPTSPHLAALGLPVAAGHLGVVASAAAAGLPVVADLGCNAVNHATCTALAELGANACVVGWECSAAQLSELVGRTGCPVILAVGGRPAVMATRQDHNLTPGDAPRQLVSPAGTTYSMETHVSGHTVIRENRVHERLDELEELLPWAAGVLLEAAGDDAHAAAENTRRLRRQLEMITGKPQNRS
jgi:putative protease